MDWDSKLPRTEVPAGGRPVWLVKQRKGGGWQQHFRGVALRPSELDRQGCFMNESCFIYPGSLSVGRWDVIVKC